MSYFTNDDRLRLVEYLLIPTDRIAAMDNKLDYFYKVHGDSGVLRIQNLLTKMDDLEDQIETTAVDGNSQLKKASTLEWFGPGEGRFSRLDRQRGVTVAKLIAMLDLGSVLMPRINYVGRS